MGGFRMTDKPSGHLPRLLTREQAAAYCGYSPSGFSAKVADGTFPGPVPGLARWDKLAIDRRLDELSGLVPAAQQQPVYLDLASEKERVAEEEWEAWEREEERRKAVWPQHNLNARQEQALRALGARHPQPISSAGIRGAGDKTFEELVAKELARERTLDDDGDRTFVLTGKGQEEYQRHLVRDRERAR